MSFGIYLHMPFCRRRCPYCDFYKKVPRASEIELFLFLLRKELEHRAGSPSFSGLEVTSVYFGGGTPSLHPPSHIGEILRVIGDLWPIRTDAEVTLEANPGTVDLHEIEMLQTNGINRLSLGVQSFSERKLQLLFRDHNASESRESFHSARRAGFKNITIDLIFGLPEETTKEWSNDLQEALALGPEHVSLYNLEYHAGTPFYRWRESGKLQALGEEQEFEMYLLAHERLVDAGYEHYEVSNFARLGFRSRHNMLYWTGAPYLGFGPSAHSYDGDRARFMNWPDLSSWRSAVDSQQEPVSEIEHLADTQIGLEWLALRLRLADGVSYHEAVGKVGPARAAALWQVAREIPAELVDVEGGHLALRPRGWFCMNDIVLKLYKALDMALPQEHRLACRG
jgi:oxygen-independent coproporphyrinogen-3 oxidase